MNEISTALLRTRKTVLEVCEELGIPYPPAQFISLKCCSSCGVWLVSMKKDLDGLDICNFCLDTYGA